MASKAILLAAALLLAAPPALAQKPLAPAAAQALLKARFAPLSRPDGPGCVAAIARGGTLLAVRADGLADLQHKVPLKPASRFDIGSTSKQFTAAAAGLLALDGKLDLDADIRTLLPELKKLEQTVTVRQLVHHSSGLPDPYAPLARLFGDEDGNLYPSDFTLRMAEGTSRTDFPPGSRYAYSNIGYLLLARIVERVSGQSLRAFADQRLFRPLEMASTHFHDDFREVVPDRASSYGLKADGRTWEWRHSDFTVMGDGGLVSTAADLARWMAFLDTPSRLPGGEALHKLMTARATYSEQGASWLGKPMGYGFGLQFLDHKGQPLVGHAGGWAGYATAPYLSPKSGIAVITLCNNRNREALTATLDLAAELADQPR